MQLFTILRNNKSNDIDTAFGHSHNSSTGKCNYLHFFVIGGARLWNKSGGICI